MRHRHAVTVALIVLIQPATVCLAQSCHDDPDCDDSNECTVDLCVVGMCHYVAAAPQPVVVVDVLGTVQ